MKRLSLLWSLVLVAGCASIVTDMEDIPIRVTTNPPGAIVQANANTYITPASILLPRGVGNFRVTISKHGYHPEQVIVTETEEPWVALNVLNLCMACPVDVLNGAGMSLAPKDIHLQLRKR